MLKLYRYGELKLQDSNFFNSSLKEPKTINDIPSKAYVDSSSKNNGNRRDFSAAMKDQDIEFVKNLELITNLESMRVKRNPTTDNEVSNKKGIDDELGASTIVRFNQSLQKNLEVSAQDDV